MKWIMLSSWSCFFRIVFFPGSGKAGGSHAVAALECPAEIGVVSKTAAHGSLFYGNILVECERHGLFLKYSGRAGFPLVFLKAVSPAVEQDAVRVYHGNEDGMFSLFANRKFSERLPYLRRSVRAWRRFPRMHRGTETA